MKTRTKFILWALPLLVIVLTFLYIFIVSNGLTVRWKFLGKPGENISRIVGYNFSVGKLYVSTDKGEMYSIPYYHYGYPIPSPTMWMKDNSYQLTLDPIYGNTPVHTTTLHPPMPFKVKQIYQFEFLVMEGTNINKFALSEDGNLWYWGTAGGVFQGLFYFLILSIEILAYIFALFIYFVIVLTKWVRRKVKN